MKKIDLFNKGVYLCTTTRHKTLKAAVKHFQENPWYTGLRKDGSIGDILILDTSKISAHFQD